MLRVGSSLIGYHIQAQDGRIGTVSDFLFDDQTWKLRWMVVDTGNWLPGRLVLIHPLAIGRIDDGAETVSVHLGRKQIESSPDLASDRPVSQRIQRDIYGYYGWDPTWGDSYFGAGMLGMPPIPPSYIDPQAMRAMDGAVLEEDGDPHLRSLSTVKDYHILATDGEIGHLENLLIDDAMWGIRYLVVDTSNWWFGQHVLIAPYAVLAISWPAQLIDLVLTRAQVKAGARLNWSTVPISGGCIPITAGPATAGRRAGVVGEVTDAAAVLPFADQLDVTAVAKL